MNKRIKELAEQASKDNSDGYPVTLEYSNRFAEKFAELIVKKCVIIGNYAHDGGEYPGPMIKEYFGVE